MTENFTATKRFFLLILKKVNCQSSYNRDQKRDIVIVDIGFKGESTIAKSEFVDINSSTSKLMML